MKLQKEMIKDELKFGKSLEKKNPISYTPKKIKDLIKSPNSYLFIAEVNSKPIGCCFAEIMKMAKNWYKYKKMGYLGMLYVDKKFRRKGIAKKLNKERIRWLKSKGIKACFNKVLSKNKYSLKFEKQEGFKPYIIRLYKEIK